MGGIPSKKTNEFKNDIKTTIRGKNTFYDIIETDADNNAVSFEQYRGKVVYGVNVASACSQTVPGYALIKKLNKMDGVVILVFPSNQFLQETGTHEEIKEFCMKQGGSRVKVFSKANVNFPNQRPVYKFLKDTGVITFVSWNFAGKFVVNKDGGVFRVIDEVNLLEDIKALL